MNLLNQLTMRLATQKTGKEIEVNTIKLVFKSIAWACFVVIAVMILAIAAMMVTKTVEGGAAVTGNMRRATQTRVVKSVPCISINPNYCKPYTGTLPTATPTTPAAIKFPSENPIGNPPSSYPTPFFPK
jgi:hypothetical protein